MKAQRSLSTLTLAALAIGGCGDDSGPAVDAMPSAIDAMPSFSDGAGVVCPNAKALYSGQLFGPAAGDDGTELAFLGTLDEATSTTQLRLRVPSANPPTGALALPDSAWAVTICLGETEPCPSELVAYSGTLQVNSVVDRLQASLSEIIFVDNLTTPTCSAALSQATIDVAIAGPP